MRFTQLSFVDEYDPTIEDSYKHYATVDGKNVLLDILDTAGQEDYASMKESYMRRGEGFLLVFSVTSSSSFESVQQFYDQIVRVKEDIDFIPMILIGNKSDLKDEREVSEAELAKLAKSLKIPYIETSAKFDLNVNELFYSVVKMINEGSLLAEDKQVVDASKPAPKKDAVSKDVLDTSKRQAQSSKPLESKDGGGCCVIC